MSNNDNNERKKKTEILTVRVPGELKDRIKYIAKDRLHSRISRVSNNYLRMSDIMVIKSDLSKIGWDNSKLMIFPYRYFQRIFDLLSRKLNRDEQFNVWSALGDEVGQYLNDIYSIKRIEDNDYISMFDIVKNMGWFSYSLAPISDDEDMVLIPKSFATKPFVYAMVYRLINKTHYPPEWNYRVINRDPPGDPEKDKKDRKKWIERYYDPYVASTLEVDEEAQRTHNFYYFRKLRVPNHR